MTCWFCYLLAWSAFGRNLFLKCARGVLGVPGQDLHRNAALCLNASFDMLVGSDAAQCHGPVKQWDLWNDMGMFGVVL